VVSITRLAQYACSVLHNERVKGYNPHFRQGFTVETPRSYMALLDAFEQQA
jgi:hypothetical protein